VKGQGHIYSSYSESFFSITLPICKEPAWNNGTHLKATSCLTDYLMFNSWYKHGIFLFFKISWPALGSNSSYSWRTVCCFPGCRAAEALKPTAHPYWTGDELVAPYLRVHMTNSNFPFTLRCLWNIGSVSMNLKLHSYHQCPVTSFHARGTKMYQILF